MSHTINNDIDSIFGQRQAVEFLRLDQKSDQARLISKQNVFDLPTEIAVLNIQPTRTFWQGQPQPGQSPACKSEDGRVGSRFGECSQCEHSVWKNRQAPGCRAAFEVTFATLNEGDDLPKVYRCERSGFSAGLSLAKAMKDRVPYEVIIGMDASEERKGTLRYFVPTFKETRRSTPEEIERFRKMRDALDGEDEAEVEETDTTSEEEDIPDFDAKDLRNLGATEAGETEVDFDKDAVFQ
jgi:hypothetical protein